MTRTPATQVGFRHSRSLPGVLENGGCALLVCTYQAGQLIAVGVAQDEVAFSFRRFDRAMGVAVGADQVAVAGKDQIWSLRDCSAIAPAIAPVVRYDRCWLPRTSVVTGDFHCHEIAWGATDDGERDLWVVNTLFSCLAVLDPRFSFVPRWPAVHLGAGGKGQVSPERPRHARRIPCPRDSDGTHR